MIAIRQLNSHIQALEKGDESSRRQAMQALKPIEEADWANTPPEVIRNLVQTLQHQLRNGVKQPSMRQEAAIVLGHLGARSEPAVPQLIDLLQEGVPDGIREAAATALGRIGKEAKAAVDSLILLLTNRRATLAVQVVKALSEIGCADARVRNALVAMWQTPIPSQHGQIQVATALCKLKIEAKGLMRYLATTLATNQEAALRKAAAEALTWCNKQEIDVVPALLLAAQTDKNDEVKQVAQKSLTSLRVSHEKAVQICAKQLYESSYAEMALKNSGAIAVNALIEALDAEEPIVREKAARTLGSLGELAVPAVPTITATLKDKNVEVKLAAAKGLWNITKKPEAVVPVLIDLLTEKGTSAIEPGEPRRRFLQTVIESLWRIGPPAQAAIPALNQKSKDKNRLISESALSALKEIAPAGVTKGSSRS